MIRRRQLLGSALAGAAAASVPLRVCGAPKIDVVVLGAGLSGLHAALLLEEQGARVTVLEASDVVGGRMRTAMLDGLPFELGASDVGGDYGRVIDTARRMNVGLSPEPISIGDMSFSIGGELLRPEQWAASAANRTVGDERKVLPHVLETATMFRLNPFNDKADAWLDPATDVLDVPAARYLREHGVSDGAIGLIDIATDYTSLADTSMLSIFRDVARARRGGMRDPARALYGPGGFTRFSIVRGCQRLPEAMAKELQSEVRLRKVVRSIASTASGVRAKCQDGSVYSADFVVCTIPFQTLKKIDISPPLPRPQAEAVAECAYGGTTHVILEATAPWWEADGFGPSMYTDGPLERIFALKNPDGSIRHLRVWVNGDGAGRFDRLAAPDVGSFVIREIVRVRPAAAGKLKYRMHYSWGANPFINGHRHVFRPGQIARFGRQMDQPWQRIHFAGEHLRRAEFGLEAAMETAERAVLEILT
jgi:monoamine oxidase